MELIILGTEYRIVFSKEKENKKLIDCDGYCDFYSKEIFVRNDLIEKGYEHGDLQLFQNKVLRHEIVHAFMYESGLDINSEWGRDETLIDWIAIQIHKIVEVINKVENQNKAE